MLMLKWLRGAAELVQRTTFRAGFGAWFRLRVRFLRQRGKLLTISSESTYERDSRLVARPPPKTFFTQLYGQVRPRSRGGLSRVVRHLFQWQSKLEKVTFAEQSVTQLKLHPDIMKHNVNKTECLLASILGDSLLSGYIRRTFSHTNLHCWHCSYSAFRPLNFCAR